MGKLLAVFIQFGDKSIEARKWLGLRLNHTLNPNQLPSDQYFSRCAG